MNKKRLLTVLCILACSIGVLGFGHQQARTEQPAQDQPSEVPDHIAYKHLFNHIAAFKKEAEKAEREGKDPEPFKGFFRRKAELSEEQSRVLEDVATECSKNVKALDAKAQASVKAYLAQYPGGLVPYGEKPAPRPTGMREMTEERDAVVLRCRDRLRDAFGEQEFKRFHGFVKTRIAPNVHLEKARQPPGAPTSDAQQSPR
jgi:hypothetical protein